jgi:hypothetical protein
METGQEILAFIVSNSASLGIGAIVGLLLEHFLSPVSRVRAKLAAGLGAAEDVVKED